ncbi:MAG: pyridoxamine 5'-phosphate oxidase [Rhizobiaceae bacterium]
MALFVKWFGEAKQSEPNDPNAMFLATADETGLPNIRVVLMKDFGEEGFTFYTNFESAKGAELLSSPKSALCFNWKSLERQVVVRGIVEMVPDDTADAYFQSRARMSRIGAWASQQSRPLKSRTALLTQATRYALEFGIGRVPRPLYWSGFLLRPKQMEFWSRGEQLPAMSI